MTKSQDQESVWGRGVERHVFPIEVLGDGLDGGLKQLGRITGTTELLLCLGAGDSPYPIGGFVDIRSKYSSRLVDTAIPPRRGGLSGEHAPHNPFFSRELREKRQCISKTSL